jgi:ribonuclease D
VDIELHQNDLPDGLDLGDMIAVDTETMGLNPLRDRLCLIQLSAGDGVAHLVQFPASGGDDYAAPNLKALLADRGRLKLYHFARFDLAAISQYLGTDASPVYCTRTASRLVRTFTRMRMTAEELVGWSAYFQILNEDTDSEIEKAKRRR